MKFWTLLAQVLTVLAVSESEFDQLKEGAQLALVAYCLKKGLEPGSAKDSCKQEICQQESFQILKTFIFDEFKEIGSGYLGINKEKKQIILAFRGSTTTKDWVNNMEVIPVSYQPLHKAKCDGCRIHQGFYNFLKNKCANLLHQTHQLKQKYHNFQVLVVGHSLGGALSLLAGIELKLMNLDPLIIAYGNPKVGNRSFARWCNQLFEKQKLLESIGNSGELISGFYHVSNEGDPVPFLPFGPIYIHNGIHFKIKKSQSLIVAKDIEIVGHNSIESDYEYEVENQELEIQSKPVDNSNKVNNEVRTNSILKLWPESMGKKEHKQYIIRIGCE